MTDYLFKMTFRPTVNALKFSTSPEVQAIGAGASMTSNGLTTTATGGTIARMTTVTSRAEFSAKNLSTVTPSWQFKIQPTWNADLTAESTESVTVGDHTIKYSGAKPLEGEK